MKDNGFPWPPPGLLGTSRQKWEFRLCEHKIGDRYKDSKFGSLYWAVDTARSMCRLAFFLADPKKDLPRITQASSGEQRRADNKERMAKET